MSHLSNSMMDVPHEFQEYASLQPPKDVLDQGIGLDYIIVLKCPHCREGWGFHWSGAEQAFRKHLVSCGRAEPSQAPPKVWTPNKLKRI